jgi:hypothetical protein
MLCGFLTAIGQHRSSAPFIKTNGHSTLLECCKANVHATSGLRKSTQVRLVISVGAMTVLAAIYVRPGPTGTQTDSSLDQNEEDSE